MTRTTASPSPLGAEFRPLRAAGGSPSKRPSLQAGRRPSSSPFKRLARRLKRAGFVKYRIYFEDEAPRIGSGWRVVMARTGRKWVRIFGPTGRARLSKADFARLQPQEIG